MPNIGKLRRNDITHTITTKIPSQEKKKNLPDLQKIFNALQDIQPTYASLAKKAKNIFQQRVFINLTKKPPFAENIPGPASYIPSNRAS